MTDDKVLSVQRVEEICNAPDIASRGDMWEFHDSHETLRARLETAEAENERRKKQMESQMKAGIMALSKATTAVQNAEKRNVKYRALVAAVSQYKKCDNNYTQKRMFAAHDAVTEYNVSERR